MCESTYWVDFHIVDPTAPTNRIRHSYRFAYQTKAKAHHREAEHHGSSHFALHRDLRRRLHHARPNFRRRGTPRPRGLPRLPVLPWHRGTLSAARLVSQSKKELSAPSPSTPSDTAAMYMLYDQPLAHNPSLTTPESAPSTIQPCYRCRTRPYWRFASDSNRSPQLHMTATLRPSRQRL